MIVAYKRATALSRKLKPLSAVLPKKNRKYGTPLPMYRNFPLLRPLTPIFLVLPTIRLSLISAGVP